MQIQHHQNSNLPARLFALLLAAACLQACCHGAGAPLGGCPAYQREIAFRSPHRPARRAKKLNTIFDRIWLYFNETGIRLDRMADGFRGGGLSVRKIKDPLGRTRMLLVSVSGVSFDTGSARLKARSRLMIARVGRAMRRTPDARAHISGHTDSTGSRRLNQQLSTRRAVTVRNALVFQQGVPASRIKSVRGYADRRKIVKTEKAEPRNRRVEIRVFIDS